MFYVAFNREWQIVENCSDRRKRSLGVVGYRKENLRDTLMVNKGFCSVIAQLYPH